jgi:hypothetical protein
LSWSCQRSVRRPTEPDEDWRTFREGSRHSAGVLFCDGREWPHQVSCRQTRSGGTLRHSCGVSGERHEYHRIRRSYGQGEATRASFRPCGFLAEDRLQPEAFGDVPAGCPDLSGGSAGGHSPPHDAGPASVSSAVATALPGEADAVAVRRAARNLHAYPRPSACQSACHELNANWAGHSLCSRSIVSSHEAVPRRQIALTVAIGNRPGFLRSFRQRTRTRHPLGSRSRVSFFRFGQSAPPSSHSA